MENKTNTYTVLMANVEKFHNTVLRSDIVKLANQIDQANSEGQLDPLVMPLLIKDEIAQKLIDRLNLYEKQYASDYGFINKQKIAHKVEELKKCIQIVQSA